MTEPRIPPVPYEEWGDDVARALGTAFPPETVEAFLRNSPDATPLPNAIATMLRHPQVAGSWLAFNNVLLWSGSLDPRLRELIVLRVAFRTRCKYEWVQHVKLSRRFNVTDGEIARVALEYVDVWPPLEAAALAATDQLVANQRIDDPTWATLAEHFDERRLVEFTFVVGAYAALAMVFNGLQIQLEGPDQAAETPFSDS